MPTLYGNFEAVRELYQTARGSVWSARRAGTTTPPDCCVKLVQLDSMAIEERDTTAAQELLVAAAVQQSMANKSEFWAPVYELGSVGAGAFYVSPLCPRSAQSVADGTMRLTVAELRIMVLSVIDALVDLQDNYGRPHGNLKPANVLFTDRQKVRERTVHLADPDATATNDAAPSMSRTPDVKAIGQLLYAVVTGKPHTTARWPLPESDAWRQLGATGPQWHNLCAGLLNVTARGGLPSLDRLREHVEAIRPSRRRVPKVAYYAAAAVVVAAGAWAGRGYLATAAGAVRVKVAELTTAVGTKPRGRAPLFPPPMPPATRAVYRPVRPTATVAVAVPKPPASPPVEVVTPPPTTVAVATPRVVTPPVVTPPVVTPPVVVLKGPEPKPPVPEPKPSADVAVAEVRSTPAPEYHSPPGTAEFERRRDAFADRHGRGGAGETDAVVRAAWQPIVDRNRRVDGRFPPPPAGWPSDVAAAVAADRDGRVLRAVDAAFDGAATDPADVTGYGTMVAGVGAVFDAVAAARTAVDAGDVGAARKQIAAVDAADAAVAVPAVAEALRPTVAGAHAFRVVDDAASRAALMGVANDAHRPLAVRVAAWEGADAVAADPPPSDWAGLCDDLACGGRLEAAVAAAGNAAGADRIAKVGRGRSGLFFAGLREPAAAEATARRAAGDGGNKGVVGRSPAWFRYDVALVVAKAAADGGGLSGDGRAALLAAADAAHAADADVLRGPPPAGPAGTVGLLSSAGPAATPGYKLRAGATVDHCFYDAAGAAGSPLEFLRVRSADGVACYLGTTEVSVATVRQLLGGDPAARRAAVALDDGADDAGAVAAMRVWQFTDGKAAVATADDDYRKCFLVSPTDRLPVQRVTPDLALYLARSAGCRLPAAREWRAAWEAARTSKAADVQLYATRGVKLRDADVDRLLDDRSRDPAYGLDDGAFARPAGPGRPPVWSAAAVASLGVTTAAYPSTAAAYPVSDLEAGGFGFRRVDDLDGPGGVFHDLVGNVAELVVDVPTSTYEGGQPAATADAVRAWFTPARRAAVGVIGASLLSPPEVDPTKAYPLPSGGPKGFADVGFRLAFTDPAAPPDANGAVARLAFLAAPK